MNNIDEKIERMKVKKIECNKDIRNIYFNGNKKIYALLGTAFVLSGLVYGLVMDFSSEELSEEILIPAGCELIGILMQFNVKLSEDDEKNILTLKQKRKFYNRELEILKSISKNAQISNHKNR